MSRRESLLLHLAAIVFFLEGVLRVASIDRDTPGLGLVVHTALAVVLFVAFSLLVGAMLGALCSNRWLVVQRHGIASALLRTAVIAAILGNAFINLGRQAPAWQVTTGSVLWTALLAAKAFFAVHRVASARCVGKNYLER